MVKRQLNHQYHFVRMFILCAVYLNVSLDTIGWLFVRDYIQAAHHMTETSSMWVMYEMMVWSYQYVFFFLTGNPVLKCAPLLFIHVHCLQKKELWSKLFNIFLELFSIPVFVSYGMHSCHTSKYDYVYMLNREVNLHTT